MNAEQQRRLDCYIAAVDPYSWQAVLYRELGSGKDFREIATEQGLNISTVRRRWQRLKRHAYLPAVQWWITLLEYYPAETPKGYMLRKHCLEQIGITSLHEHDMTYYEKREAAMFFHYLWQHETLVRKHNEQQ